MPTPIRARNKPRNPVASPQSAVMMLQEIMPTMMSMRRLQRSATQPSGKPITL
jgi:hypothetical protein